MYKCVLFYWGISGKGRKMVKKGCYCYCLLLLMILLLEYFDFLLFCKFMDLVIGWGDKYNKDFVLV